MGDPDPGDGPSSISNRFTLTDLACSVSDTSLSPVISKLVGRAVDKAFVCESKKTIGQSEHVLPKPSNDDTPRPSAADGDGPNLRSSQSTRNFSLDNRTSATPNYYPVSAHPSSTQVLVPINPFPEESELRFGPTSSFVQKHTILMESESVMATNAFGMRLHRNPGSVELDNLVVDSNIRQIENVAEIRPVDVGPTENVQQTTGDVSSASGGAPTEIPAEAPAETSQNNAGTGALFSAPNVIEALGGLGAMFASGGDGISSALPVTPTDEFYTLLDEMTCQVAAMADDVCKYKGYFEQAYKTFSELAKTAAANITAIARNESGPSSSSRREETGGGGGGGADRPKLPQEVKDRVLRTLSDIKTQLGSVKTKLQK